MNKLEGRINALATVVPHKVVELIKAHFLVMRTDKQIDETYNKVFKDWKREGLVNGLYVSDKLNESFSNIEDHLWLRACGALNDWLYKAYVETFCNHDEL